MVRAKLAEGADQWHSEETDPRLLDHEFDLDLEIGNSGSSDEDFEETSAVVFGKLVDGLAQHGIRAVAIPGGEWAGFELYLESKFEVPGLSCPSGFRYWKTLHTVDPSDRLRVKDAIVSVAAEHSKGAKQVTVARWLSFVEALTAYQRDEQTSLHKISRGMQTIDPYRTRTYNGTSGHFVVVPPKSWYPESVQQIDARSLLTILPDVEAQVFMLNMGRVVAGWSSQQTAEGQLTHEYRYFCGLIGGADLGKTTLVEKLLKPALVKMGLKTSVWNIGDKRFGWARRATADWYTLPDCLTENTINVITDPQQKILSAGEPLTTEEKCQGDVIIERPAAGGFVFMANAIDSPKLQLLDDDGITNRFKLLLCKERIEIANEFGVAEKFKDPTALQGMIGIYWSDLAEQLGVTTELLAMWVLTNCCHMFLESCGYSWVDGRLVAGVSKLKKTMAELTNQLRAGTTLANKKDVIGVLKHLIAYSLSKCYYRDEVLPELKNLELSYMLLAAVLEVQVLLYKKELHDDELYKPFIMETLAHHTCHYQIMKTSSDYIKKANSQTDHTAAFAEVAKAMKTKAHMFGYPSHPAAYSSEWTSAKLEIPILMKYWIDKPDPVVLRGRVSNTVMTEITKLLHY